MFLTRFSSWLGFAKYIVLSILFISQVMRVEADTIRVAAASDLNQVLPILLQDYASHSDDKVSVSFGASGNLTRQIIQGAPFDLFMSADESYVQRLQQHGLTQQAGVVYGIGQLVLFIPNTSSIQLHPAGFSATLTSALAHGQLQRLAIANPDHAPYGRVARQALQQAQLWPALQDKMILGENAAQTARFVLTGNVDAGLIPRSIVSVPALAQQGRWLAVAQDLYAPLRQRMVLLAHAQPATLDFYRYLQTPAVQKIFQQHGFLPPSPD